MIQGVNHAAATPAARAVGAGAPSERGVFDRIFASLARGRPQGGDAPRQDSGSPPPGPAAAAEERDAAAPAVADVPAESVEPTPGDDAPAGELAGRTATPSETAERDSDARETEAPAPALEGDGPPPPAALEAPPAVAASSQPIVVAAPESVAADGSEGLTTAAAIDDPSEAATQPSAPSKATAHVATPPAADEPADLRDAGPLPKPPVIPGDAAGPGAGAPAATATAETGAAHALRLDATSASTATADPTSEPPRTPLSEARFVQQTQPAVVTAVRTQLLPDGGTMTLRLDPPALGSLQITVTVREGVVQASFVPSTDESARLLAQTLPELRRALEGQGVHVERLQVQPVSRSESPASSSAPQDGQQDPAFDDRAAQQEQQRRELLRRMWQRAVLGRDDLDLVA